MVTLRACASPPPVPPVDAPLPPTPPTAPQFLGGHDDALAWLKTNYLAGAAVSRPPRVVHASDERVAGDGAGYDYDLVVIGGGSGGLACSKEAAALGARVACLDFVKPSWQGTKWGLGGTCVNVGCIPKKLMHTAALLGEALGAQGDAAAYGWDVPPAKAHKWGTMVSAVQDHIKGLNYGYVKDLRSSNVKYLNALGAFKDAHTLTLRDAKGAVTEVTARRVVVAVGGRPTPLAIPGGELALSSDDLFSLKTPPGRTLVVGASYVALECAGFLAGFGYPTAVMVRSILLRGFDRQCAEMIGEHMAGHGVRFIKEAEPSRIEKTAEGKLRVFYRGGGGGGGGGEASEEFDTVFVAVGRKADTVGLNLAAAGVEVAKDGKLPAHAEQTNVPHIYAIGDVLAGLPELTPVAIAAGKLLARRLFGGATQGMDYEKVPTTVFTPLEYGCVGLAEEAALASFGEGNVEVFHSQFKPLEWSVNIDREGSCYAKIIVHKADNNRVVGFHVLGPHAGEVTQGWACAIRLGATYESFLTTVGIHPTLAEEFTGLTVSKSSGESAEKEGC